MSGAHFARPNPCLVTTPLRLQTRAHLALQGHAQVMVVKFMGAHVQYPLRTRLGQSANVATRYFSHSFCGCPPNGRHYQQNNLLQRSYHEQLRLLNQALLMSTHWDMYVRIARLCSLSLPIVQYTQLNAFNDTQLVAYNSLSERRPQAWQVKITLI